MLQSVLLLATLLAFALLGHAVKLTPVESLEMRAFSGRWFEMYASVIPKATYERNMTCVTADYGRTRDPHSLSVTNSGLHSSPQNVIVEERMGKLMQDPDNPNGELAIDINGMCFSVPDICIEMPSVPFLVIGLSEKSSSTGEYEWAIVSDHFGMSMWILARDPMKFYAEFEEDCVEAAKEMGFDKCINRPMKTYQGDDCIYAETSDRSTLLLSEEEEATALSGPFFRGSSHRIVVE